MRWSSTSRHAQCEEVSRAASLETRAGARMAAQSSGCLIDKEQVMTFIGPPSTEKDVSRKTIGLGLVTLVFSLGFLGPVPRHILHAQHPAADDRRPERRDAVLTLDHLV